MTAFKKAPLYYLTLGTLFLLGLFTLLLPKHTISVMENRALSAPPSLSAGSVLRGTYMHEVEKYLEDQFFLRDGFVMLQSAWNKALLRTENRGILLGDRLMAATQQLDTSTAMENAQAMGRTARACGLDSTVVIVPLSSAVTPERLPLFYRPLDQNTLLESMYAETKLNAVDSLAALLPLGEDAFYRTDHHWTAKGAYAVYQALCNIWDLAPQEADRRITMDGFYGSYYAKVPQLFMKGDTFSFDWVDSVRLTIDGQAMDGLLDEEKLQERDRYAAALYGNHAIITLTGPGKGVLLVVKDSYANALLPLLARHFQKVVAVDLRYTFDSVEQIQADTGADRLLFVYGLSTLLTDRNLLLQP